jgi:hypothetical protein
MTPTCGLRDNYSKHPKYRVDDNQFSRDQAMMLRMWSRSCDVKSTWWRKILGFRTFIVAGSRVGELWEAADQSAADKSPAMRLVEGRDGCGDAASLLSGRACDPFLGPAQATPSMLAPG